MTNIPPHIDRSDPDAVAAWLASGDFAPDDDEWIDAGPLREVVAADDAVKRAREHLADRVHAARAAGLSWSMIGAVLGVSKQAARQRFGTPQHA